MSFRFPHTDFPLAESSPTYFRLSRPRDSYFRVITADNDGYHATRAHLITAPISAAACQHLNAFCQRA